MNIKKTLKQIKGVSTPFVGISWDLSKSEKEIIKHLIAFLEDRRVLYNPYDLENSQWVIKSITEIRHYLTKVIQELDEKSNLNHYIRPMRAACRKFMNENPKKMSGHFIKDAATFAGLGEVRAMFGFYLKDLTKRFKIEVEKELATIFPIDD